MFVIVCYCSSPTGEESVCSLPPESAMDGTDEASPCPPASSASQIVDWIARMEAAREKFRNAASRARFFSDNFDLILLAPALKATRSCPVVDERDSVLDLDDRQVSALEMSTLHDPPVPLQLDEPVFDVDDDVIPPLATAAALAVGSSSREVAESLVVDAAADLPVASNPMDRPLDSFMNLSRPLTPEDSSEVLPPQPPCRGRKSRKSVRFALDAPVKRRRFCFCC